jgi:hypothetical protein
MNKTFVCPEVRVPSKALALTSSNDLIRKRNIEGEGFKNKKQRNSSGKSLHDEQRSIRDSIRELSAQSLRGLQKLNHKEDKLTKLGVPPPKEQSMPFKMKMGILAGREKRKRKHLLEAKEAGTVLAVSKTAKKNTSKKRGR